MTVTVRLTAATEPLFTGAAALFDEYRQHYGANPAPDAVAAWMLEQVLSTRVRIYVACSEPPAGDPAPDATAAVGIARSGGGSPDTGRGNRAIGMGAPRSSGANAAPDPRCVESAARYAAISAAAGARNAGSAIGRATTNTTDAITHDPGPGGRDPSTGHLGARAGTVSANSEATHGTPGEGERGPVAYGICSVAVVPAALTLRTVWLVRDLFVVPAARHQGVARALLAHVAREARAAGAHRLSLQTETSNVRAIELYAKNGFGVLTDVAVMDRLL